MQFCASSSTARHQPALKNASALYPYRPRAVQQLPRLPGVCLALTSAPSQHQAHNPPTHKGLLTNAAVSFALQIAQKRRSGFQEIVARLLSSVSSLPESSFADYLVLSGASLAPGEQVPEALRRPRGLPDNSGQLADAGMIARLQEGALGLLRLLNHSITHSINGLVTDMCAAASGCVGTGVSASWVWSAGAWVTCICAAAGGTAR